MKNSIFDIIVMGGGHAGVEAAYIASQFKKLKIAIITLPGVGIASAPCNPAIGGVGKGQVVRELDALGGLIGKLADQSGIQYRTLNDSKGFAVQSTRIQIDKVKYSQIAEDVLTKIDNITIIREKINSVKVVDGEYIVQTNCSTWNCKKLIVTVGTFLRGKLHIGEEQSHGGRMGCESSNSLSNVFSHIKTNSARFKTGTPARLHKDSIDYNVLEEQASDDNVMNFHYAHPEHKRFLPQRCCYLARTNKKTIDIISDNKDRSPMYNGQIKAVGARYCPSIEDKVNRYPDKYNHHVFVEPESLELNTVYPSGISSSLPKDVQLSFITSIKGLEHAKIEEFGYAVEYDVVDTTELNYALEYKAMPGLYFAGQVNGTSGYEEAAGQGFVAGVNASLSLLNKQPFKLDRNKSYVGVMIEDLISNTRDEPYRLFTARSENRLYIREDNAIVRMAPYRESLGLNCDIDTHNEKFLNLYSQIMSICDEIYLSNTDKGVNSYEALMLPRRMSVTEVLRQANINPISFLKHYLDSVGLEIPFSLLSCVAISKKYEGYINKANIQNEKLAKLDRIKISWSELKQSENISFECKQRIEKIKPETFGQLRIIEGIRPATLAAVAGSIH